MSHKNKLFSPDRKKEKTRTCLKRAKHRGGDMIRRRKGGACGSGREEGKRNRRSQRLVWVAGQMVDDVTGKI